MTVHLHYMTVHLQYMTVHLQYMTVHLQYMTEHLQHMPVHLHDFKLTVHYCTLTVHDCTVHGIYSILNNLTLSVHINIISDFFFGLCLGSYFSPLLFWFYSFVGKKKMYISSLNILIIPPFKYNDGKKQQRHTALTTIYLVFQKYVANFKTLHSIILALLEAGAHIDSVNSAAETPLTKAASGPLPVNIQLVS